MFFLKAILYVCMIFCVNVLHECKANINQLALGLIDISQIAPNKNSTLKKESEFAELYEEIEKEKIEKESKKKKEEIVTESSSKNIEKALQDWNSLTLNEQKKRWEKLDQQEQEILWSYLDNKQKFNFGNVHQDLLSISQLSEYLNLPQHKQPIDLEKNKKLLEEQKIALKKYDFLNRFEPQTMKKYLEEHIEAPTIKEFIKTDWNWYLLTERQKYFYGLAHDNTSLKPLQGNELDEMNALRLRVKQGDTLEPVKKEPASFKEFDETNMSEQEDFTGIDELAEKIAQNEQEQKIRDAQKLEELQRSYDKLINAATYEATIKDPATKQKVTQALESLQSLALTENDEETRNQLIQQFKQLDTQLVSPEDEQEKLEKEIQEKEQELEQLTTAYTELVMNGKATEEDLDKITKLQEEINNLKTQRDNL